ncbi:MAG: hypothetical protein HQK59_02990 [Deltaproteobacteria bacterium]|nr:hypothetical protein [Deltaproteobacteria bacterium]MBF0523748.1 hypothetical protein [Deltaproteobacteria bacterium]
MNQESGIDRGVKISLGLTFIVCLVATYWFRNYTQDDALIYYRYIRNALEGEGLVYNPGERFNGLTSPLYSYLSLLVSWATNDITQSQIWLGGVGLFLTCLVMAGLFRPLPLVAATLPLMLATSRYFYSYFGLETSWFLFLAALAILLYQKNKYGLLGVACACLLLVRGESLFLVLILAGRHFLEHRPFPRPRLFIIPAVILAGHYTFTYWYYGKFLPSTLAAKIYQGKSGLWGAWPCFLQIADPVKKLFDGSPVLIVGIVVTGLVGTAGFISGIKNRNFLTLLAFTVACTLFYVFLNIPNYPWYFSVHCLLFYTGAAFGLDFLYKLVTPISARFRFPIHRLGYGLLVVVLTGMQLYLIYGYVGRHGGGWRHYVVIGQWLEQHTPPDAQVACSEIGHIGWYSKRKIIDIVGLVNHHNARLIGERKLGHWLKYYQPDYILIHNPPWLYEQWTPQLVAAGLYAPDARFDFPGFSLFARRTAKVLGRTGP